MMNFIALKILQFSVYLYSKCFPLWGGLLENEAKTGHLLQRNLGISNYIKFCSVRASVRASIPTVFQFSVHAQ